VIREGGNRPDVIVSILKAAKFSRGMTLAKITVINLIESTYSLKQYISILEKMVYSHSRKESKFIEQHTKE
jgi:hypothetical protein